jgi:hypothetical protein
VNEQERTALTLASLDAAIQMLTTQRDLLALSLLGSMELPEPEPVVDGECPHAHRTQVEVMGAGLQQFCIDCETILT